MKHEPYSQVRQRPGHRRRGASLLAAVPVALVASALAATTARGDDLVVTDPVFLVTGTIEGNVIVTDGARAVLGDTHIKGNVIVEPGGALGSDEDRAVIEGNVQAEGGLRVRIFNDEIHGDLQVKECGGDGEWFIDIYTSVVHGNVQYVDNDATIIRIGANTPAGQYANEIHGDVQIFDNDASDRIVVAMNVIDGNVQCGGNNIEPFVIGNTVGGNIECDD